eukprot:30521_1
MLLQLSLLAYVCVIAASPSYGFDLSVIKNYANRLSLIMTNISIQPNSNPQISLLINGHHLFNINTKAQITNFHINNISTNNRYVIAMYRHLNKRNTELNLIGINTIDVNYNTIINIETHCNNLQCVEIDYINDRIKLQFPRVSTYYSVWETWVGQAWQNITYNMKQLNMKGNYAPNIETLLQSNNTLTIYDLLQQWKWTINSTNSSIKLVSVNNIEWYYWQQRPYPLDYYCIYEDNNRNILPNCTNISKTLREHAYMLQSSGVDFIVLDLTNDINGINDSWAYSFQIQPTQILYQYWSNFRKNNTDTPEIVVWNPANGIEWQDYLNIYNKYSDLVYQYNNKMIYFVMSHTEMNNTVIDLIESNGNKNNVKVMKMWVAGDESVYKTGQWTYMSPCRANNTNYLYETTSVEALNKCNLKYTTNSFLGTQVATSFNYETWSKASYTSLPFGSPTKLNGRTLKLTVGDALNIKPDNILFPSFNEHQCSIQNMSEIYGGNNTWSVGLGYDLNGRNIKFMDQYGSERSRAFEPTYESGDYYFKLFQSCIRVMKLSFYYNIDNNVYVNNNKICNIEGEICCDPMEEFIDVYSLKNNKTNDFMVSNNKTEVIDLIDNENYNEICVPTIFGNSSVFCENNDDLYTYDQHRGPFILYQNINSSSGAFAYTNVKRIALYRCEENNSKHFISNDIKLCNENEYTLLGYGAVSKSSAMARKLVRCQTTANGKYYYHVIDDNCLSNDISSDVLAYVL